MMNQNEFALKVQVGIGRDLRLPQFSSLQVCRDHVETIIQMFEDGFTPEATIDWVKQQVGEPEAIRQEKQLAAAFW
jgi:hypothetical protein